MKSKSSTPIRTTRTPTVRPLPFTGEADERRITRRHFIRQHPRVENLFSIIGGKLTTYRSLSEEVVDLVFKKIGRHSPKCATAKVSLPGNKNTDLNSQRDFLTPPQTERLQRVYGTRLGGLWELITAQPALGSTFDNETGALAAEIVFSFKHEFAQTLADCLLRRTMVGLNSSCGGSAVESAAEVGRRFLGWSDERCASEIEGYRKAIERMRHLRVRSNSGIECGEENASGRTTF